MSNIYEAVVDKIKDQHEKYDLAYTAFRSLCHSQGLCEGLIKEIIETYEELSPSIAGNVPHILNPCTECGSHNVRMGEISLSTPRYWVQDLHCQDCNANFARFNLLQPKETSL